MEHKTASQDSSVNTLTLPNVGDNPATLAAAVGRPFRVAVNNIGPNTVLVSYDIGSLTNTPPVANTYPIQVGKTEVFVLQPGQRLFACGQGTGGKIGIAVSVAIPETFGA